MKLASLKQHILRARPGAHLAEELLLQATPCDGEVDEVDSNSSVGLEVWIGQLRSQVQTEVAIVLHLDISQGQHRAPSL